MALWKYSLGFLAVLVCLSAKAQPAPPVSTVRPQWWFFTATATNLVGESDHCPPLAYLRVTNNWEVTLAWDGVGNATGYYIYMWRTNAATNAFYAGSKTSLAVNLFFTPYTNWVVRMTSSGATNILWSYDLDLIGPWQLLGATNWTGTNQPGRFFIGVGRRKAPQLYITNWVQ